MGCNNTTNLLSVEEAIANMLKTVTPVSKIDRLPLTKALGYVVAKDIMSPLNVPSFANSAMDGYALRSVDLSPKTQTLTMIGKAFAGQPFSGIVEAGQCVRIMTGAPLPAGADCVIMQEETHANGDKITFENDSVKINNNIRPIGDDLHQGDLVIAQGTRLSAREMPLLASLGVATVDVFIKPIVAFFSTGDELQTLGNPLAEGQIYDSNRYGISALLTKMGCDVLDLGIIPDDQDSLRETFLKAADSAHMVITSGGVSVGEADYTKQILEEIGHIDFWKIAMKPGKPFAFGRLNNALFCGLPGNPVSAMVTFYQLVQPLLAKLSGHSAYTSLIRVPATTHSALKKQPGRVDFQRGIAHQDTQGQWHVTTTGNQGSGAFRSMHLANCFIILERERGRVEQDETVTIELFNTAFY